MRGIVAGAAATTVATAGWATLVEPRWFALRERVVPSLPRTASRPLSMLHLSDLHLQPSGLAGRASRANTLRRFLERCLAEDPDLVVVTGDLTGHPDAIDEVIATLAPLVAERPGLVTLGSSDAYGPTPHNPLRYLLQPDGRDPDKPFGPPVDTGRLLRGLSTTGWTVVENAGARVDTPSGPIDVVGLGDAHIDADRPEAVPAGAIAPDVLLRLGVAHAPYARVLEELARRGCHLAVCGHTHGGQVRVPGIGALATNCDLPRRQASGVSAWNGLPLHVSAGLGMNRYSPYRFACRPEATILRLVPAGPDAPDRAAAQPRRAQL
ncbi:metallophosphoesterase [Egibacter rhizosphaerae]|uniref:Metallophosphoesterase n=1 Tax=Egibacter rhizosphaerae TaxID=1670831 RepID=A0A411YL82_9ACTN|nr:metallophosphoesterase [Egibacter rhizosphaerae]